MSLTEDLTDLRTHQAEIPSARQTLHLDIFSDVICPWCLIGKRRLSQALSLIAKRYAVNVTWRVFQLNPSMPPEGVDRKVYRTAKFGSWSRSLTLDAQLAEVGAKEGIPFAFDRIQRTPNTFDAHRLIWLAQGEGVQDAVVEALFRGYFTEGMDIGDRRILSDIASTAGLISAQVESFLASDEGVEQLRQEEAKARQLGISGVPYFLVNGKYAIEGAQPAEKLVSAFDQAMQSQDA
jgi:predicted DsbA family dithiol-disulfide isomerase